MQHFPLVLTAANPSTSFAAEGHALWYESGTAPSGQSTAILVKPENGNAVKLRPGQMFGLPQLAGRFYISSFDGTSNITGNIIIGSGKFEDNSSLVTLDATFANEVTVKNASLAVTAAATLPVSIASAVEIANDAGNPIPTTLTGTATVQENILAISGGATHTSTNSGGVTQVLSNAANTNGAIINSAGGSMAISAAGVAQVAIVVKNGGVPASATDGITIAAGVVSSGTVKQTNFDLPQKIRIPAGWGVAICNAATGSAMEAVQVGCSYTLL